MRTLAVGAPRGNERPTLRSNRDYPPGERLLFTGDQADRRGRSVNRFPNAGFGWLATSLVRGVCRTVNNGRRARSPRSRAHRARFGARHAGSGPTSSPRGAVGINFLKRFEQVRPYDDISVETAKMKNRRAKTYRSLHRTKLRLSYFQQPTRLRPALPPTASCVRALSSRGRARGPSRSRQERGVSYARGQSTRRNRSSADSTTVTRSLRGRPPAPEGQRVRADGAGGGRWSEGALGRDPVRSDQ